MKKVAIVTGGSRGIGAAIAKQLSQDDYAVCINYNHSKDQAERVMTSINDSGGSCIICQANIGNENDIIKLFNSTDEQLGSVTALVNNAGINGGISEVKNITIEKLLQVYNVNVFGTILACREAIKRMQANGGGSIINITSEAAKFGGTKLSHYASSKAAINTFTIGCAREIANDNIRINAVSPGVINTDIHKDSPKERIEKLLQSLPMKRMGEAEEVAKLVSWLASDESSYISGTIIPVTGAR